MRELTLADYWEDLTGRERDVLLYLVNKYTTKKIHMGSLPFITAEEAYRLALGRTDTAELDQYSREMLYKAYSIQFMWDSTLFLSLAKKLAPVQNRQLGEYLEEWRKKYLD